MKEGGRERGGKKGGKKGGKEGGKVLCRTSGNVPQYIHVHVHVYTCTCTCIYMYMYNLEDIHLQLFFLSHSPCSSVRLAQRFSLLHLLL